MGQKKGCTVWNKGTHIQSNTALEIWRKKGGQVWNKGKKCPQFSGKNHPMYGVHKFGKESPRWKGGLPKCKDCGIKLSYYKGIRCMKCNRKYMSSAKNGMWKGGLSKDKEYIVKRSKVRRHKLGISKKYNCKTTGIRFSIKQHRQKRKALIKGGGKLTIHTIQLVYEDNIKKYGTLTCYLCEKPIPFGKDHLEHKTPLSRGGMNDYNNLAIACQRCNNKKYTKTEEEYRKEII